MNCSLAPTLDPSPAVRGQPGSPALLGDEVLRKPRVQTPSVPWVATNHAPTIHLGLAKRAKPKGQSDRQSEPTPGRLVPCPLSFPRLKKRNASLRLKHLPGPPTPFSSEDSLQRVVTDHDSNRRQDQCRNLTRRSLSTDQESTQPLPSARPVAGRAGGSSSHPTPKRRIEKVPRSADRGINASVRRSNARPWSVPIGSIGNRCHLGESTLFVGAIRFCPKPGATWKDAPGIYGHAP